MIEPYKASSKNDELLRNTRISLVEKYESLFGEFIRLRDDDYSYWLKTKDAYDVFKDNYCQSTEKEKLFFALIEEYHYNCFVYQRNLIFNNKILDLLTEEKVLFYLESNKLLAFMNAIMLKNDYEFVLNLDNRFDLTNHFLEHVLPSPQPASIHRVVKNDSKIDIFNYFFHKVLQKEKSDLIILKTLSLFTSTWSTPKKYLNQTNLIVLAQDIIQRRKSIPNLKATIQKYYALLQKRIQEKSLFLYDYKDDNLEFLKQQYPEIKFYADFILEMFNLEKLQSNRNMNGLVSNLNKYERKRLKEKEEEEK